MKRLLCFLRLHYWFYSYTARDKGRKCLNCGILQYNLKEENKWRTR